MHVYTNRFVPQVKLQSGFGRGGGGSWCKHQNRNLFQANQCNPLTCNLNPPFSDTRLRVLLDGQTFLDVVVWFFMLAQWIKPEPPLPFFLCISIYGLILPINTWCWLTMIKLINICSWLHVKTIKHALHNLPSNHWMKTWQMECWDVPVLVRLPLSRSGPKGLYSFQHVWPDVSQVAPPDPGFCSSMVKVLKECGSAGLSDAVRLTILINVFC